MTVRFGTTVVVEGISFDVYPEEIVAIVGESGSGKSMTVFSATGLMQPGSTVSGESRFGGEDLLALSGKALRSIYGSRIGYIFQDVMTSLNPVRRIRSQIKETFALHLKASDAEIEARAVSVLKGCGIVDPDRILGSYPHELSGGLRQRVMIGLATGLSPALLIADEPTTALDTSTQAQVLDTLAEMSRRSRSSVVLVTHNLGVVAALAHRVIVMYCGRILETASSQELLDSPGHPYTAALLAAVPLIDHDDGGRLKGIPGEMPSPLDRPAGCIYAARCPYAQELCLRERPELRQADPAAQTAREVACHFPLVPISAGTQPSGQRVHS
ncbi:MAG: ABC transporter ATP-binding protein [Rhizobiales bacterium]|nr:ABC transporter ATP-binding protein [Hyphomicrobiales bacterium]